MASLSTNSILKWLLIITAGAFLLHFGYVLFVPMLYGLLVAFVMYPICLWIENRGVTRYIAITVCIAIVVLLFAALLGLLAWQIDLFRQDWPEIAQRIQPELQNLREWLQRSFSITIKMQDEWLQRSLLNSNDKIVSMLDSAVTSTVSTLFMLFLIPIYTALFLYHRGVFVLVMEKLLGQGNKMKLQAVLKETIYTYANYFKGMILVYIIVGILNSAGLLALGIRHAVLFGMLTAIMTIIPYVGIIISALLPISIAFVTKDSVWYPIGVVAVFTFVQYLEGNIIFPWVVGKQLNVSTWAMLVAIVAGGIIWGVSGMILFIPFVAILKIVAEYVPEWDAMYTLLGRND